MDELPFVPGIASGPIRGLAWLAQVLQEQAELEMQAQTQASGQAVAEAEAAFAAGEIPETEVRRVEQEYLDRVIEARTAGEIAGQPIDEDR